jgi:translation initiation factor IF-2
MRVHELAKELGLSSKELISDLKSLGIDAKNHMSALDSVSVEKIRQKLKSSSTSQGTSKTKEIPKTFPNLKNVLETKIQNEFDTPQVSSKVKDELDEKLFKDVEEKIKYDAVQEKTAVPPEVSKKMLELSLPITVKDFAQKVEVPTNQLIAKLIDLGEMMNLNTSLTDQDMVTLLGAEYGFDIHFVEGGEKSQEVIVEAREELEKPLQLVPRAPIVTFMGHVDHGKTSLLDQIRKSKVADHESGGITQHMGAYEVVLKSGKITFLDTPGHEAFTLMRARGAQITDIVILVIAADDGMMPQTHEALSHCKAAGVPVIVAINKVDKPNISLDKVKRQLSEKGMTSEDWGGQTIVCEVSAKTGKGIDHLLEMILLQAEIMELKADPSQRGKGIVVESELTTGKGATATVLVRQGTFHVGDAVICGTAFGRIKALLNDQGKLIREAGPSTPVEVLGLSEVPEIGIEIKAVKNEKLARQMAELKLQDVKNSLSFQPKKMTLEDIFQKISNAAIKEFRLILKADVKGSLEALQSCLSGIKSEQIDLKVIHEAVGDISENDVMLASASGAIVIGFQVRAVAGVKDLARKEGVDVRLYSVIYEIVDDVRKAIEGLLEPLEDQVVTGHALIQKVYELSKSGKVAGCSVIDGKLSRSSKVRVLRNGEILFEGSIQSLKRFKDEVKEVREGFECGIRLSDYEAIEEGDTLEFFEIKKIAQKLT